MAVNISMTSSRLVSSRKILSATFSLISQTSSHQRSITASVCKHLYTKEALGLQGYEKTRERTATELGKMKDRFKERMNQYLGENSTALIFTEDLKNILYLSDSDSDLAMIDKMMKKYAKQNEQMRFGSFIFGPVIMRMFHHLGKPDMALASLKDPETVRMYDQLTSYQVAMDLLFDNQRYDEVLEVFEILKGREFFQGKFPKDCLVLAVAACYKMGTKEPYKKALGLIKAAVDANTPVMRKAVSLASFLALKNDDAAGAMEMLAVVPNQSYVTIRNLKALALLKMDRLDDILPLFRSVIEQDVAYQKRVLPSFFQDVVDQVKEAVEKSSDAELKHEFEKVFKSLEHGDHTDKTTLQEFLERPIEDFKRPTLLEGGGGFSNQTSRYQPEGSAPPLRQPRYRDDNQQRQAYGSRYGQQGDGGGSSYHNRSTYQDRSSGGSTYQDRSAGGSTYQDRSAGGSTYQSRSAYRDRSEGQGRYGGGGYGGRYGGGQSQSGYRRSQQDGESESVGDRSQSGFNPNAEAGYRPQSGSGGGFRQRSGAARQGLQDLDD